MPGAIGVFLAPSGMGTSTTLIAMLLGPYKGIFDQVHVFSASVDIDSAWLPVKEIVGNIDGGIDLQRGVGRSIAPKCVRGTKQNKDPTHATSTNPLPQILSLRTSVILCMLPRTV